MRKCGLRSYLKFHSRTDQILSLAFLLFFYYVKTVFLNRGHINGKFKKKNLY